MNLSKMAAMACCTLVFSACGDGASSDNSANGAANAGNSGNAGNAGNAGNVGENAAAYPRGGAVLDTSDYVGTVMWQTNTAGMTIDLGANAETQFTNDENEEGQQISSAIVHIEADLSADGGSVAYVRQSGEFCPAVTSGAVPFGKLSVVAADGSRQTLDVETPNGPAACRNAREVSIDGSGSAVAFSYRFVDSENSFEDDIAVWDLAGEPTVITTSEARDYNPILSADASTVAFLSDRDAESEFFIGPADGSAAPEKVIVEHADFDGPHLFGETRFPSCSDDLSICAFIHGDDSESRAAYVFETASGEVTRLGLQSGVSSVSLSGDGSTAAITVGTEAPLVANVHIIDVSVADDGAVIGSMNALSALTRTPELNTKGSLLLVANQEQGGSQFGEAGGLYSLSVWRTDGSEKALVESDETDDRFFLIGNVALGIR